MDGLTARDGHVRNRGTILGEAIRPARSALGPREAFLVAHEKLSMLARIAPQGAFVIAVLGPDARVLDAFQILDRTALIIGRHSRCGLVLPHDALCLRHLAVLVRSERVHVWDLNTHQPFSTEDGPSSAVVADGPLYVSLGEYAFWIVPACSAADGSLEADEALAALPPRKVIDHRVSGRKTAPSRAQVRMPPDPVSRSITCLTRLGPPLLVGEGDAPEIGWGVLRFEFQGQKEKRHVSAERLEQGLLVGRYNRCGISFGQCIQMSRVHMLLVRIDDELWAIDTASSNGVRRAGVRVTAEVLADDDALEMAGLAIRWRRHKLAQA